METGLDKPTGLKNYVQTRLERVTDFSNNIELSEHPDLTLSIIKKYSNVAWNFNSMMYLPQFNMDWVEAFPSQYWDWNELSMRASIDDVNKHPNLFWNWRLLSQKFSHDVIMNNPHHPWDFTCMNIRPITTEHVPFFRFFKHKIPQWKWHEHARRITWSVLKETIDLPWAWYIDEVHVTTDEFLPDDIWIPMMFIDLCNWIDLTINVHIDIINEYPTLPWRMDYIQWNRTAWKTKVQSIDSCIREWSAASTIKRYWKNAISNPEYSLCKKRIQTEFKELERECNKMSSTVTFTKLRSDAITPSKATTGSIGLDLHSVDHYVVLPGQRVVVSTGLRVTLPPGTYGRIAPRSGLAVKHGLDVGAGVVDPDYTGELRVVLFNHDAVSPFIIRPGWRIAQLIIERAVDDLNIVEDDYVEVDTERGNTGFGSTGY